MDIERADNFIASLGIEAYRVGGSVRDELIGRPIKDADYMIRGVPLGELGDRLRDMRADWDKFAVAPLVLRDGRQAGWRVSARGLGALEIVLPRTDVPREPLPGENRHRAFDIVIDPNVTIREDAKRRDFTLNALYRRIPGEGIEIFDPLLTGMFDLSRGLVRTTTPTSFRDDPLRTLRALRFVSTLGYSLATDTRVQMTAYSEFVTGLSAKGYASGTVYDELSRILMGDNVVTALVLARDTGVLARLLPELAPMIGFDQGSRYHDLTTDEHTFKALETAAHVGAPLRVRWSLLFHDSGKPDTAWRGKDGRLHYYEPSDDVWKKATEGTWFEPHMRKPEDHEVASEARWGVAARRLGIPSKMRDEVATLIREHMVPAQTKKVGPRVRRMRVRLGDDLLRDLLLHRVCDLSGKGSSRISVEQIQKIALMEKERGQAQAAGVPASVKELAINGHDLKELGIDGRQIGVVLRAVLDEVVCQPDERRLGRDWQLERAEALR